VTYRRLAYLPDRRSTRVEESIAITISGFDSSHNPYHEKVATLSVSCHGCRYLSGNRVGVGDMTILEPVALGGGAAESPALARIRSVKLVPENPVAFEIAVELALPRNIWGIATPPEDWVEFGYADSTAPSADLSAFEVKRAQVHESKPMLVASMRASRVLGDRLSQLFPSLLADSRPAHETAKSIVIQTPKTATAAESSNQSLDELCSRLESKASVLFEELIAGFAEEISGRSAQSEQTSPFETFERDILGFQRPAPNSARRLA